MNVPKLRFKEFTDEWNTVDLSKTFNYFSTNSLSREKLANNGIIKNIHYGDIHKKYGCVVDIDKEVSSYIKDLNYNNIYEKCRNNDLIFADASEDYDGIGKAIEIINVNESIVSGLHTILARDKSKAFSPMFKGYYFNSPIIHNQIRVQANGFKVFGISKETINSLNAKIPNKEEQTKIANFLSLLDKKIELQTKKIEDLKLYKKGLLEKQFNENYQEISLKNILKERKEYSEKGLEYPHVTLSKDGIYDKGERYNRDFLVKSNSKEYKITKLNDLCYNPANLKFGVICLNEYGSAIFSPIYITFEINKIANPLYIKYYTSRNNFINAVRKYEQGTVYERMSVSPEDFLKFSIKLPKLATQNKIVKRITNFDKKIDLEEKKLIKLQELKKGLMQSMFV